VVLCWGFNFVAVKVLQPMMSVEAIALLRFLVMASLLVPICWARKEPLRWERRDMWHILGVGFASMGVYMILFLEGLERTSAAEGAIVLATAPIMTYLLSCALGQEVFRLPALAGALVAFVGVTIVILGGAAAGHGSLLGNLIVLASSVMWSVATVMMRPLLARYKPVPLFTMSLLGGFPVMLVYGLPAVLRTDFSGVTQLGWVMFSQISVLSGVVAFVCFYEGLRQIGAAGATLYQFFVPPTAALAAWLVMGKALAPVQFIGLVVVLAGVIYSTRARAVAARRLAAEGS